MCVPGALPPGVSVTITCFEAAFDPSPTQEGAEASSTVSVIGLHAGAAETVLDLQPTQRSARPQPAAARCALTVATAQHCLAVAALALAMLARCRQLRPASAPDGEEEQLLCRIVAELMQYGDAVAQVRPWRLAFNECLRD